MHQRALYTFPLGTNFKAIGKLIPSRPGKIFATGWRTGLKPITTCLLGAICAEEHSLRLNANSSHRINEINLMAENWQCLIYIDYPFIL